MYRFPNYFGQPLLDVLHVGTQRCPKCLKAVKQITTVCFVATHRYGIGWILYPTRHLQSNAIAEIRLERSRTYIVRAFCLAGSGLQSSLQTFSAVIVDVGSLNKDITLKSCAAGGVTIKVTVPSVSRQEAPPSCCFSPSSAPYSPLSAIDC